MKRLMHLNGLVPIPCISLVTAQTEDNLHNHLNEVYTIIDLVRYLCNYQRSLSKYLLNVTLSENKML